MKILHIIDAYLPAWDKGGPIVSVHTLNKELVNRGHKVDVYTTDIYKKNQRYAGNNPFNIDGVDVFYFKNISNGLAWNMYPFSFSFLSYLYHNIIKYDVIHLTMYRSPLIIFIYFICKLYKKKYIIQPRGQVPRYDKTSIKKIFDNLFGNRILTDSTAIIVSSKIEKNGIVNIFPRLDINKISIIPNSVDLFDDINDYESNVKIDQIDHDGIKLLYLGRIHERKGIDLLIKSIKRISVNRDDIHLLIVGPDDGFLEKVFEIINELSLCKIVHYLGPMYGKDKKDVLLKSDLLILPSTNLYESFGNVVVEAMLTGTPIIVTNVCGVSEYINKDIGCVSEPNINSLTECLLYVINNLHKYNKEDIKKYSYNFNIKNIVEKYLIIYQK